MEIIGIIPISFREGVFLFAGINIGFITRIILKGGKKE